MKEEKEEGGSTAKDAKSKREAIKTELESIRTRWMSTPNMSIAVKERLLSSLAEVIKKIKEQEK